MFKSNYSNINDNTIFIDIDDTICDTRGAFITLYKKVVGEEEEIYPNKRNYEDMLPQWSQANEIETLFRGGKHIYELAKPVKGAREAVTSLLSKGFDIRLVTLNFPESVHEKQKWVNKYFPELTHKTVVLTSVQTNKDIFKGFAIIDDDIKNIKTNSSKFPILIDIYRLYDDMEYSHKYNSWKEIIDKF